MALTLARRSTGRSTPPGRPGSCCRSASTAASPPTGRPPARCSTTATLGTPRLLRSVTRDPGGFDPVPGRPGHDLQRDPDPRLRRAAVPQPRRARRSRCTPSRTRWSSRTGGTGACSTPRVVVVRFDNGAIGDRRGVLRGHVRLRRARRGVRLGRHGHDGRRRAAPAWRSPAPPAAAPTPCAATRSCCPTPTSRELAAFVDAVRDGDAGPGRRARTPAPRWRSRWPPRESVRDRPPGADRGRGMTAASTPAVLPARGLRRDGLPRPAVRGAGPADRRPRLRGRDLGLDEEGRRRPGRDRRARSPR